MRHAAPRKHLDRGAKGGAKEIRHTPLPRAIPMSLEQTGARPDELLQQRRELEATVEHVLVEMELTEMLGGDCTGLRTRLGALERELSALRREFNPLFTSFAAELDRRAGEANHA